MADTIVGNSGEKRFGEGIGHGDTVRNPKSARVVSINPQATDKNFNFEISSRLLSIIKLAKFRTQLRTYLSGHNHPHGFQVEIN